MLRFALVLAALLFVVPAHAQPASNPFGPPIKCDAFAIYDASTNGSTVLVTGTAGKSIYVCGYVVFAAGTAAVELDYGSGTTCATGLTRLLPAFQLTTQVGVSDPSAFYRGMGAPAGKDLCIKTNAGVAVQAVVYYTQF